MPDSLIVFVNVLAFALLPVAGTLGGSLLGESVRAPRWLVGAALHGAAGIAIALVGIDLMPRLLQSLPMWAILPAFLAGAGASLLLARAMRALRHRVGAARGPALMVYVAVAADLASDGLMTGAGAAVAGSLGLLIGATQAVANIPGGFAATKNLQDSGVPRPRRWLLAAGMALPALASALAAFWLLRSGSGVLQETALAFIVGVLLLTTIEDIVPEGDRPEPPRWISTLAFALGFAGLGLASAYLG
ncbi:zinc transporter, ZIP family [Tistlia consotensis]|uniref:Zinc transporter, ZIP family n=1 Tax=Tistlia consotensis USBA 355 TaxID=560819 RepID=A0A1Y6C9G9_9PROT|nr:hypothetical protein [Tistlia consotensis]SMF41189.1 zinc transporter, ZIP family [Tistlia consotensis USBA 355]SNR73942.1 zinc transporter, ZIP family [Tistlia consotensis]